MRLTTKSPLSCLIPAAALLSGGPAGSQEVPLAIAVILHAAANPKSAASACQNGTNSKSMDVLGVTIQVECPAAAPVPEGAVAAGTPLPDKPRPEVMVTF